MAKVSFSKLGLNKEQEDIVVNFNEQEIEVKPYISVNEKLELISNVINSSADENNFANPIKVKVFTVLEILYHYTNINFTEKLRENPVKLYDAVVSNGLAEIICEAIPEDEYDEVVDGIADSIESIYQYRNSVLGVLESVSKDYSALDLDATQLTEKLSNPENMKMLKDVLNKLG